ncbi:MAG TPA: hypothetical protein EYN79_08845 [Planctomycetes bacterium]|nr:hypothetical protein [Planctomycetota bacterium]
MSLELTVTVIHDGDPDPPPRSDLTGGFEQMGEGCNSSVLVDQIYFLSLPAGVESHLVSSFADRFLAGAPASRAEVHAGIEFPVRPPEEASIVVLRRPGVMDPVEGSVLHALADAGLDVENCSVKTALRYRISAPSLTRDGLELFAESRLGNGVVDEWHCFLPGEVDRVPDPFRSERGGACRGADGECRRCEAAGDLR